VVAGQGAEAGAMRGVLGGGNAAGDGGGGVNLSDHIGQRLGSAAGDAIRLSQKAATRYGDEFLRCRCSPDLAALGLFPNYKEITETFAAYRAVRKHLPDLLPSDPLVSVVAVGDGHAPRTAATFAMRSAWECHSVDPELRRSEKWGRVRRMTVWPLRVQNLHLTCDGPCVIVAVHSHATLADSIAAIRAPRICVVAIPCCVPLEIPGQPPDVEYQDFGIVSEARTVRVWKRVSP
jgi:hypothetical protein